MKKLFYLPLIVALFTSTALNANKSELTLRMYDNNPFDVSINGRSFHHAPQQITFSNIIPGRNHIRIFKYRRSSSGFVHPNPRVVFDGYVNIRPGLSIYAVINHRGRFVVEKQHALHRVPHRPHVHHLPYMSNRDFQLLVRSIKSKSFDSSKLSVAKQAVSAHSVKSIQVRQLLDLFSFESNKLELAKFAYHYTYDKHRYFLVNDAFTFSSSVRALNTYIAKVN